MKMSAWFLLVCMKMILTNHLPQICKQSGTKCQCALSSGLWWCSQTWILPPHCPYALLLEALLGFPWTSSPVPQISPPWLLWRAWHIQLHSKTGWHFSGPYSASIWVCPVRHISCIVAVREHCPAPHIIRILDYGLNLQSIVPCI